MGNRVPPMFQSIGVIGIRKIRKQDRKNLVGSQDRKNLVGSQDGKVLPTVSHNRENTCIAQHKSTEDKTRNKGWGCIVSHHDMDLGPLLNRAALVPRDAQSLCHNLKKHSS